MEEKIPLVIGRQSTGEETIIDLRELPNLFISYSNDDQLPLLYTSFIQQILLLDIPVAFSFSLSSRLAEHIQPLVADKSILIQFMHATHEAGKINTIVEFVEALSLEGKRRKALSKMHSPTSKPTPLVVFIDDIFEVLMLPHKKTPLLFIELLITGAMQHIYFILGSTGIYRNLLNQIIHVNPSLQRKLKKPVQVLSYNQPLGAELVMNPDGLLFYRERDEKIHKRLYPM